MIEFTQETSDFFLFYTIYSRKETVNYLSLSFPLYFMIYRVLILRFVVTIGLSIATVDVFTIGWHLLWSLRAVAFKLIVKEMHRFEIAYVVDNTGRDSSFVNRLSCLLLSIGESRSERDSSKGFDSCCEFEFHELAILIKRTIKKSALLYA